MCPVCSDPLRDQAQLLIVEKDADLEAIERAHTYTGYYFVLGGTLGILEKNPEKVIRLSSLKRRVEALGALKEIIIATAVTPESEHTGDYVRLALRDTCVARGIEITRLGRGVSTGSEIEYADADTLRNALLGRK
jgi:recombination protein RecR